MTDRVVFLIPLAVSMLCKTPGSASRAPIAQKRVFRRAAAAQERHGKVRMPVCLSCQYTCVCAFFSTQQFTIIISPRSCLLVASHFRETRTRLYFWGFENAPTAQTHAHTRTHAHSRARDFADSPSLSPPASPAPSVCCKRRPRPRTPTHITRFACCFSKIIHDPCGARCRRPRISFVWSDRWRAKSGTRHGEQWNSGCLRYHSTTYLANNPIISVACTRIHSAVGVECQIRLFSRQTCRALRVSKPPALLFHIHSLRHFPPILC
jgi:hypothetical protein